MKEDSNTVSINTPLRISLPRLDSVFSQNNDIYCKEFTDRFVSLFVAPEYLPSPENFTAIEKTYPSRKSRYMDDYCSKG